MTYIDTHDRRKKDGMCQYILIDEEKIHRKKI